MLEAAPWVAVGVLVIGQAITIVRYGRNQTKEDASLQTSVKTDIANIKEDLSHPDYGLIALSKQVSEFKTNCAKISTALATKVAGQEKSINGLKEKIN